MSNSIILGIDEVGRGPWAGPLVVGAVILGADFTQGNTDAIAAEKSDLYQKLADSKRLTAKQREALAPLVQQYAASFATGWVSAAELDRYGLSASLKLATRRAVKPILATKTPFTEIIIDGTVNFLQNTPLASRVTLLKKADSLIKEVSAASIIAKVARDAYMAQTALQYPVYGFEKHVGYGTALHHQALLKHGICPEHRTSFRPIREIIARNCPKSAQNHSNPTKIVPNTQNQAVSAPNCNDFSEALSTSAKGQTAEKAVAERLQAQNHTIITQNFKTKTYEIDLISTKNHQIFFTEVKYSRNTAQEGTALVRITPAKQRQMHYAAQAFLAHNPNFSNFQPFLAVASVSGTNYQVNDWFVLET